MKVCLRLQRNHLPVEFDGAFFAKITMLDLTNKTILVSIRRIDEGGQDSFDTFFGNVISFSENTVRLQRQGGAQISVPYDEELYEPAEPGLYELQDGTAFENPDFIAQWCVFASEAAAEKFKKLNP